MIKRSDYHLFVTSLLDSAAKQQGGKEGFDEAINRLMWATYEINNPKCGRVDHVDITDDMIYEMGQSWAAFQDVGIQKVEFISFYIHDELVLETGAMEGVGNGPVAMGTIKDIDRKVLKSFARAMILAMKKYGITMYQDIVDGSYGSTIKGYQDDDDIDIGALVKEYMEDEVDDAVADFSKQLDSVFSVADIPPPKWSPPGGEAHDQPRPPL